MRQERRLNFFHLRCLKRIRKDHITNIVILSCTGIPSMHPLLSQSQLTRELRDVNCMGDRRITKEVLYWYYIRTIGDRSQESREPCSAVQGRMQTWPQSMRNWTKQLGIHGEWLSLMVKEGIEKADVKRHQKAGEKRACHKNSSTLPRTECSRALAYKAAQDDATPPRIDNGTQACLWRLRRQRLTFSGPPPLWPKFNLIEQRWRWKTGWLCNMKKWSLKLGICTISEAIEDWQWSDHNARID